jgi:hypothetical protein
LVIHAFVLTKGTVQEEKSPVKISSVSVVRRDLIPALMGEASTPDKLDIDRCFKSEGSPSISYRD